MVRIICPDCGHEMSGPDKAIGKMGRCKKCSTSFRVTKENSYSPRSPAQKGEQQTGSQGVPARQKGGFKKCDVRPRGSAKKEHKTAASQGDRTRVAVAGIMSLILGTVGLAFYNKAPLCLAFGVSSVLSAGLSLESARKISLSKGREPALIGMVVGWIVIVGCLLYDIILA